MISTKKCLVALLCGVMSLNACTHTSSKFEKAEAMQAEEIRKPLLAHEALSLDLDSLSKVESAPSEDHLFGKFFNDRAEYFVIENPSNTIFQTNINSITLFHLDGKLGQTKYVLEKDIASTLLKQFGACKIVGLDSLSKILVESESIVSKKEGKLVVNPKLTAYELRWVQEDKDILYRVRANEAKENYVFVERLKSYQTDLLQIEGSAM